MFGYEPADLAGWSIDRILPGFEVAAVDPHRTVRGVHRDGREIPLELTISRSTKQTLRVAVIRDISERLGTIRRIEFQAALLDQVRTMVVAADLFRPASLRECLCDRCPRFDWCAPINRASWPTSSTCWLLVVPMLRASL
ncbi:MAG: hypothetical protein ACR2ME_02645 [Acidimicrobiia bacterium]